MSARSDPEPIGFGVRTELGAQTEIPATRPDEGVIVSAWLGWTRVRNAAGAGSKRRTSVCHHSHIQSTGILELSGEAILSALRSRSVDAEGSIEPPGPFKHQIFIV